MIGAPTMTEAETAEWVAAMRNGRKPRIEPTPPPVHGTNSAYRTYGCRCPECTAFHADYQRGYRGRK